MASRSYRNVWDFTRSLRNGRVLMWPHEPDGPHWIGQLDAGLVMVAPSPCNSSVAMIQLARSYQEWAAGRPLVVVGTVSAGRYDVTVAYHTSAEAQEMLLLPSGWARMGYFALGVRGDSMRDAGIQDGDYVVVRPQSDADNGDLVVAGLTDSDDPAGYVTLKQFFRDDNHVRLQPANAAMAPIHLYPQQGDGPVGIQGKVVAVVRLEDKDWLE